MTGVRRTVRVWRRGEAGWEYEDEPAAPLPCHVEPSERGHYIAACGAGFRGHVLRNAHDLAFPYRHEVHGDGPYRSSRILVREVRR